MTEEPKSWVEKMKGEADAISAALSEVKDAFEKTCEQMGIKDTTKTKPHFDNLLRLLQEDLEKKKADINPESIFDNIRERVRGIALVINWERLSAGLSPVEELMFQSLFESHYKKLKK